MKRRNLLYAQSGGVTAVINATAAAVIETARARGDVVAKVLAARHGILGVLGEELIDTAALSAADLAALGHSPGGAFGSCRFDLDTPQTHPAQFDRLFEVLEAHDVGYFLYNGGNGSMDTVDKIAKAARARSYPLVTVGVPKTVDNDIEGTDCCPGFGSAAKYVATSMLEAGLDVAAMGGGKGRVFVMEVMGRNAGWIAAATALAAGGEDDPPHLILLPEAPFDEEAFLARVADTVGRLGYCTVTVSEGIRRADGTLVMEQAEERGYIQLGGAGQTVARLVRDRLGYKHHWAIPDYLQRAAAHLVSATDLALARAVGEAAVEYALAGRDAVMPAIRRLADAPYRWTVEPLAVDAIANLERRVPPEFIRADGMHVTPSALVYLRPLIEGEAPPRYAGGLPAYCRFRFDALPSKLPPYDAGGATGG